MGATTKTVWTPVVLEASGGVIWEGPPAMMLLKYSRVLMSPLNIR